MQRGIKKKLFRLLATFPTTNGGMQKWKLGRNTCTLRARFFFLHVLAPVLRGQSVLVNRNFCVGAQSEACQGCVVGWVATIYMSCSRVQRHLHPRVLRTSTAHTCFHPASFSFFYMSHSNFSLSLFFFHWHHRERRRDGGGRKREKWLPRKGR